MDYNRLQCFGNTEKWIPQTWCPLPWFRRSWEAEIGRATRDLRTQAALAATDLALVAAQVTLQGSPACRSTSLFHWCSLLAYLSIKQFLWRCCKFPVLPSARCSCNASPLGEADRITTSLSIDWYMDMQSHSKWVNSRSKSYVTVRSVCKS